MTTLILLIWLFPAHWAASRPVQSQLFEVAEEYYEEMLKLNPLLASSVGDHRYNDRLAIEISDEYRSKEKGIAEKFLAVLNRMNTRSLSEEDRVGYAMLKTELQNTLEAQRFPGHLIPINQMSCLPIDFAQMGSGGGLHPFKTVKDYENFLYRLNDFVRWVDVAIANMNKGIQQGIVQPKTIIEASLPQWEKLSDPDTATSIFFRPIKNMPREFSQSDKSRLSEMYRTALVEKIAPTYTKLHSYLKGVYLPTCRNSISVRDLPNGEAWYRYWVRYYTTTDLSPGEIFDIGMSEVRRIKKEMENTVAEIGFKGTVQEFLQSLATDPHNQIDKNQVITEYVGIRRTVESNLSKLFSEIPKAPYEIRPVEEFQAQAVPLGFYQPAAPDGSRPGAFYVNIHVPKFPKYIMEYLFLHEAVPGHHFDRSIAQEKRHLPRFRRFGYVGAYIEGWGLYAESLGKDLGLYKDPYQYFGMLVGNIGRAARLAGDAGIHYKGWTKDEAAKFLRDSTVAFMVGEIDRYAAIPGQALAYKVGQMKILRLRARAEKLMGREFDIRRFHDVILRDGAVPLDGMEKKVDAWLLR